MKETDLKKYRTAWKSEQSFEKVPLSESDVQGFLKKKSKDINKLFRGSLIIDIVLKTVIGISFLILPFIFHWKLEMVVFSSFMICGTIIAIIFQLRMIEKIPGTDYSADNLRSILENKINFYNNTYFRSLYVSALSNSLFFMSGILYYFSFKYGEIRSLTAGDYLVLGIFLIAGFILGAYIQIKNHNFQIRQLESCLNEIDENMISELTIKKEKNRKLYIFLAALLAIICGLLVLAFIAARLI
jgi:anaerobic C4-dicarboxylate transporter